ncbi:MAG TPA: hypothetical protein DGT21_25450 [Armatimonadetes bacterium]|jgi:very-short-patch-repair endonuclease|nr:hypothetical protein [Armatimonadota bacterium]
MGVAGRDKVSFAREQRRTPNPAEKRLWGALRGQRLGVKFRRQHPIGDFVLDFYWKEKRLAVEVDGGVHEDQADYDEWRDAQLAAHDIRTLRLTDAEVLEDLARVVEMIKSALRERG